MPSNLLSPECGEVTVAYCSHEPLIGEVLVRNDGFVLDVLYDHLLDLDAWGLNHWLLGLLLSREDQVLLRLGWWHTGDVGGTGLYDFLLLLLADLVDRVQDLLLLLHWRRINADILPFDILGAFSAVVQIHTDIVVDILG